MHWNEVLEQRLKTAKKGTGWTGLGYAAVALGLLGIVGGGAMNNFGDDPFGWDSKMGLSDVAGGTAMTFGGLFLLCGIVFVISGSMSKKRFEALEEQKAASQP